VGAQPTNIDGPEPRVRPGVRRYDCCDFFWCVGRVFSLVWGFFFLEKGVLMLGDAIGVVSMIRESRTCVFEARLGD
jgi:hypothetical protein